MKDNRPISLMLIQFVAVLCGLIAALGSLFAAMAVCDGCPRSTCIFLIVCAGIAALLMFAYLHFEREYVAPEWRIAGE